ncbi:MAG: PAS domain S-box protein [Proteobacteria bacterium]|nr:PAS domain S-box protein [Pseudomonadota bacterium]
MLTQTNMFYAEIHSLDQWTTFGGESITVPDAVVSSWSHGYFVLDMITALFCWWCVIWLFRRQEKRKAVRLGLANLAFVLTIVGYRLVRTLATGIPPVGELGVFAFILMMNTDLSSGLWRKLKQSNERLTSEINERLGVEKELRQLRNYLFNIINSMPSVLIGVDNDRKVTQWNKAAEQYTGVTAVSAEGKSLLEIFPRMASADEKIAESIRTGQVTQTLTNPRLTEDATFYEDLTIYPLSADGVEGAVIRIDDVTNKVRMEEMLIQSEKMLSMGGLAAGMAHEINNPIAGMMQTASVMADRLQKLDMSANLKAADAAGTTMEAIQSFMKNRSIPQMIATIIETGRRVAVIVNNMLSFARKSEAQVLPQSLPRLLDKALELAATDYDLKKHYDFKQIEIEREYEDSLPSVPCEGAKIQQVLLNILSNGAQAMANAETKRPRLIVRTKLESGQKMACIEIEDNGPGMTEATRKRIFEPFYTTKPEGEGTGLGLSVSYFIVVENHGGNLTVESRPGSGAKFTICLPLGKANA